MEGSGDGVCVLWCLKHLLEFNKIKEDAAAFSLTHDITKRVQLVVELLGHSKLPWLDELLRHSK